MEQHSTGKHKTMSTHTTTLALAVLATGEPCGHDVLLHIAAWLRELACLVPDLATYGYQRDAPQRPRPQLPTGRPGMELGTAPLRASGQRRLIWAAWRWC
jgi:hypothetical protein